MAANRCVSAGAFPGPRRAALSLPSDWGLIWPSRRSHRVQIASSQPWKFCERSSSMSEMRLRTMPLAGKRILVTRAREQAGVLSESLRSLGAQPVELPVIRIVPPEDWSPLDRALGVDPQALAAVRIATIGPATAAALEKQGLSAALVPDEYIAEGVAQALRREATRRGETLAGQRILLARAAEARRV